MSNPLVSVYIPTRNRALLLRRAIASCLNQSVKEIEVIVVNDASDDETQCVIDEIVQQDDRVTGITNQSPIGACASRNKGIMAAKAKYVTGLDDDDYFESGRIQGFLEQAGKLNSLLCTSAIDFDGRYHIKSRTKNELISLSEMYFKNWVGNQAFFEREKALAIGCFDEKLISYQDYDFWIRMIQVYGDAIKIDNHSLVVCRNYRDPSISNSEKAYQGFECFMKKHKGGMTTEQIHHQEVNAIYNFGKLPGFNKLKHIGISKYLVIRMCSLIARKYFGPVYAILVRVPIRKVR